MDRITAYLTIYASIVQMQFHPGVKQRLRAKDCLGLADYYFNALTKRLEKPPCQDGSQESEQAPQ